MQSQALALIADVTPQKIGLQRMKRGCRWEKIKIQLGGKEIEEGKRVKAMRNWGIWAIEFLGRKEASTRFDTAQTKHRQSGDWGTQWDTSSGFPYELICCGMGIGQARQPIVHELRRGKRTARSVTVTRPARTRKAKLHDMKTCL